MRTLTPAQEAAVAGPVTAPCYLLEVSLDEMHYWSTRNQIEHDDNTFVPAQIQLGRMSNNEVQFSFYNADYQWTQGCVDGVYLRKVVRVWWAYGPHHAPLYVNTGYWDDGYTEEPDTTAPDPILLFDGLIYSFPTIDDWVTIVARRTPPRLFPNLIMRPPFANFLPAPGYTVTFDGSILQIQE